MQAKKFDRAIAILARHSWWDKLIEVVRAVEKTDQRCLSMCAQHFRKAGQYQYAKETLLKMDDTKALITLYVEEHKWDDAFLLLNAHPGALLAAWHLQQYGTQHFSILHITYGPMEAAALDWTVVMLQSARCESTDISGAERVMA